MAVIAATVFKSLKTVPVTITRTILSAADTLVYAPGTGQILDLFNTTASPVIVTITGSTATTISPDGYGGTVSVAAGKTVAVPAGATVVVHLDDIYTYLSGNVTVTLGTGVIAQLFV